jgi:type IV secretory pathway TrbD component
MNKAVIDSYLRNLLGSLLGAITIVSTSSGIASPVDYGLGEWLLVANALWASAVPTLIRWVNKKDPAFGLVAQAVAASVTTKLETAAEEAPKKAAPKAPAKAPAKKPAAKKTGGSGSKPTNQAQ